MLIGSQQPLSLLVPSHVNNSGLQPRCHDLDLPQARLGDSGPKTGEMQLRILLCDKGYYDFFIICPWSGGHVDDLQVHQEVN